MILVIGDRARWAALARAVPEGTELRFAAFRELSVEALAEMHPELVVSALVDVGFDALDVALLLSAAGFEGRFRAVSPPLADLDAVRGEVQEAAGGLDFEILILTPRPN